MLRIILGVNHKAKTEIGGEHKALNDRVGGGKYGISVRPANWAARRKIK